MRFITSIFMLLTTVCGVSSAYFIGHGIVVRHEANWPWFAAAGLMAASAVFGVVYLRLAKNDPQPVGHGAHAQDAHGHTPADGAVHTHPHGSDHHR